MSYATDDYRVRLKPQPYSAPEPWTDHDAPETHLLAMGYGTWLLGFTGLHRFYYGKPLTGALWFFTGGLLLVGWIIDFFLIPSMAAQADRRFVPGRLDYTIAWVLHLLLGLFGAHRFYMGKWISGIVWLLTGGLCGIGWIYDLCTLNSQVSQLNATT